MISVIISTFNRADSLRDTLESLCLQDCQSLGEEVEVLIINNNCTDHTEQVVTESASKAPFPIRHIFEPKQGISAARNRGIRESRGEYLIFTDDDVIVQQGWFKAYQLVFHQHGAECASGKIVPLWEKTPEPWIYAPELHDVVSGVFALLDHGDGIFVLNKMDLNFMYGANMGFKKSCIAPEGFREDLGLIGKKRRYGEDTELIRRFFQAKRKMVYSPHAVVHHKVPASRVTMKYLRKWRFEKAVDAPPVSAGKFPPFWLIKECAFSGCRAMGAYLSGKQVSGILQDIRFWTQAGQIAGILSR